MNEAVKKELLELKAKTDAAEKAYNEAFIKAFPVGCEVTFEKGTAEVWAEILSVSAFGRHQDVTVRNLRTGKEYSVGGYWLIEGLKA